MDSIIPFEFRKSACNTSASEFYIGRYLSSECMEIVMLRVSFEI